MYFGKRFSIHTVIQKEKEPPFKGIEEGEISKKKYLIENINTNYEEITIKWQGKVEEEWLAEAITQYLEVIITARIYNEKDLPKKYFEWYKERILKAIEQKDRAIANFSIIENTYVCWYCKGSWTFWDLEGTIKRERILDFFTALFKKYAKKKVKYETSKGEAKTFFEREFSSFFDSWFLETGFEPKFR